MEIQLKAGFGKVDITPAYPVPLQGYGNGERRIHATVLDPIYAICVAISDGENKLLLYHLDLTGFAGDMVDLCRERILKEYGISADYLFFNATHNHSAPQLSSKLESIQKYRPELVDKIVAVGGKALEDLAPATIEIGSGQVEDCNYVRRYLLSDGSYGGDNFGDFKNNTILAHETEADREMQAVRLVREGKKDIVMVNWQAHPHRTGGSKKFDLSSDLVEHFRNATEAEHGVLMAFYQGCAGNINSHSRMEGERCTPTHVEVGHDLAMGLTRILSNMRPVKSGPIRTSRTMFEGPVNHSMDDKVDIAQKVVDFWKTCEVSAESAAFARQNGFNSVYHASEVIAHSKMPDTISYNIGAFSFGDVCFAWAPNELYDTTGIYLKASSPFEMTFICGYSNGYHCYMPTIKAFAHGGYGCDTSPFPAGVTEKLTNEMLDRIVEVKG